MPVRFGCEHNCVVFPVSMLDHPMARPDPGLHAVLTRLADLELEALTDKGAFPSRVRESIELELHAIAPLEVVAGRLRMSPSTVRSRLQQYGTNYSALLDRVRRERAKRDLRQSELSVSEVAHRLGFAHPPAFHRAVRRWFGVTPTEYRDAPSTHPAARFLRG
jgi:AraC-like DNA-binding protein